MTSVLWNDMGVGSALSEASAKDGRQLSEGSVATVIRQLFNNAKSLEKAGNNSSGLYASYAFINHACISNAKVVVGKNYKLEVNI